jgi:hypothetical protein
MNLRCPANPEHATFLVTAHVAEEWRVNREGDFIEVVAPCAEVIHEPDTQDYYVCAECGADAIKE